MHPIHDKPRILIVGAGMAGLAAARALRARGHELLLVDKGRGPGGRLANRRFGGARFDHGAQFFTARDPEIAAETRLWQERDILREWFREPGSDTADRIRWRGRPAMTAIARELARDLPFQPSSRVLALGPGPAGWRAQLPAGEEIHAETVLLTPPVPQSLELLRAGQTPLTPEIEQRLEGIQYERCLALMARLDAPPALPEPGCLALDQGPIAWIADNQRKGVSHEPALTLHARPDFSLQHWDEDRATTAALLLEAAAPWIGTARVLEHQIHGWRYSRPLRQEPESCLWISQDPPLLLAGDAFGGPRIEGALLSGRAAAAALR